MASPKEGDPPTDLSPEHLRIWEGAIELLERRLRQTPPETGQKSMAANEHGVAPASRYPYATLATSESRTITGEERHA